MVLIDAKDDGQFYKLNFGHTLTENDPFHQAYLKWAEAVSKKTGGKLQIEVYPSSQLGVEEDILEQMKQGTNVGWQTDAARLGNYVNEFSVLLAPYFLENMDEVKELMDSPTIWCRSTPPCRMPPHPLSSGCRFPEHPPQTHGRHV